MDARTCRNCKRLFNYLSGPPICPGCREKLEVKFKEVREYVRDNPFASLKEVSDATGVSVKQLKNWVREERLKFSDDSPVGIECMNCGTMIKYGKYCDACKSKIIDDMNQAVEKPEKQPADKPKKADGNRMRFLDS